METTRIPQSAAASVPAPQAAALRTMLIGGLIAGALDLTFAFVFYWPQGARPIRTLQFIASGILGPGSFDGGFASAALGAAAHFFISVCAAGVYYLASLRFAFLTRRWAIAGAVFGVLMFLAMHYIVVPLSAIKPRPIKVGNAIGELFSHVFFFGMVIAYAASRAAHHIKSSGTTKSL